MSTYTDLDSSYRDLDMFPNPFNYTTGGGQIASWSKAPRQVTVGQSTPSTRAVEFSQSLKMVEFILPYITVYYYVDNNTANPPVFVQTIDLQRIYIDVHTVDHNDSRLINSLGDRIKSARFALAKKRIQESSTGVPQWIHYETKMDQVTRWTRDQPVTVAIMQEQGWQLFVDDTNPINPSLQNWILLEIIPYFRDSHYTNQGLGLTQLT